MSPIEVLNANKFVDVEFMENSLVLGFWHSTGSWNLTSLTWPVLYQKEQILRNADRDYANVLRSLIDTKVSTAEEVKNEALIIRFAETEIRVSLKKNDNVIKEIAYLQNVVTKERKGW